MKGFSKYKTNYYLPPVANLNWTANNFAKKIPIWCSVDLRDGNQSLVTPMNLEEKIEYFKLLVGLGFKEIEIGFPAASETEFQFARKLIENNLIPDDVTIQVFTQARDHIIDKTFESIKGVKKAIIHMYNSISSAQREQVFKKSKDEIISIAAKGASLIKQYAEKMDGSFQYQYCAESFTGTEIDFALDICNAVLDVWQPTPEKKAGINLPATVSLSMPHVYANQIEYMNNNLKYRENVILSLHPHNDRGTAVADTELGLLAGADKVEGTLFGNGERTGNVDIITLAKNFEARGIASNLKLENLAEVARIYEKLTKMKINSNHPYLHPEIQGNINFEYVNLDRLFKLINYKFEKKDGMIHAKINIEFRQEKYGLVGIGTGHLEAIIDAFQKGANLKFEITDYSDYALETGSTAKTACYVKVNAGEKFQWGIGVDNDMIDSSILAIMSGLTRLIEKGEI